jgi:hypothetical protein
MKSRFAEMGAISAFAGRGFAEYSVSNKRIRIRIRSRKKIALIYAVASSVG